MVVKLKTGDVELIKANITVLSLLVSCRMVMMDGIGMKGVRCFMCPQTIARVNEKSPKVVPSYLICLSSFKDSHINHCTQGDKSLVVAIEVLILKTPYIQNILT